MLRAGLETKTIQIMTELYKQQELWQTTTLGMEHDRVLCGVITEKNHPFKHDIIGKPKEQLLNRRPYVLGAIEAWRDNKYNATPNRVAYNINYFEVELKIIDKELSRLNAT